MTTAKKFTNEGLTILYLPENTKMPTDELISFSLDSTVDFERGIEYDTAHNSSVTYSFNQIEIFEESQTQRYIINFYDTTVMPLMKLIKRRIYPMSQFCLIVEVADYDTKPQYAKDLEQEYMKPEGVET